MRGVCCVMFSGPEMLLLLRIPSENRSEAQAHHPPPRIRHPAFQTAVLSRGQFDNDTPQGEGLLAAWGETTGAVEHPPWDTARGALGFSVRCQG